jgi:hypothetical protein
MASRIWLVACIAAAVGCGNSFQAASLDGAGGEGSDSGVVVVSTGGASTGGAATLGTGGAKPAHVGAGSTGAGGAAAEDAGHGEAVPPDAREPDAAPDVLPAAVDSGSRGGVAPDAAPCRVPYRRDVNGNCRVDNCPMTLDGRGQFYCGGGCVPTEIFDPSTHALIESLCCSMGDVPQNINAGNCAWP